MAIPTGIWEVQIGLALLCTAHCWFGYDAYNYTDVISGILAFLFWLTSGWLAWIFIGISVIVGLIALVKLLDVIRARKSGEQHVNTNFDMRL